MRRTAHRRTGAAESTPGKRRKDHAYRDQGLHTTPQACGDGSFAVGVARWSPLTSSDVKHTCPSVVTMAGRTIQQPPRTAFLWCMTGCGGGCASDAVES